MYGPREAEEKEFGPDKGIHRETHNGNKKLSKNGKQNGRYKPRLLLRSVLLSHFSREHGDTERGDEEFTNRVFTYPQGNKEYRQGTQNDV